VEAKSRILAVDDTPANLVALEAVLERDFDLRTARSGPEAIAMLQAQCDVDVILMDVQMPGMDGYEAAARIKQLPHCAEIPIVFITAVYTEDPYIKRGYAAGGVDYFTKPFDPDLLRLKVGIYASFRQRTAVVKEREAVVKAREAVVKERERQLRETEELLEAGRKLSGMLESLPVGVLIADVEGRICQSNEAVSRICKSVDLIANDAYGALLGWWDSSGKLLKGPLSHALGTKESRSEVLQIRCVDGSTNAVLAAASPLHGVGGDVVGAVIVLQDVSEPRRLEAELQNRIARLISLGVELEQSLH
jgi:response regulator RpfG family c-di-GMP phosphodiesterase